MGGPGRLEVRAMYIYKMWQLQVSDCKVKWREWGNERLSLACADLVFAHSNIYTKKSERKPWWYCISVQINLSKTMKRDKNWRFLKSQKCQVDSIFKCDASCMFHNLQNFQEIWSLLLAWMGKVTLQRKVRKSCLFLIFAPRFSIAGYVIEFNF